MKKILFLALFMIMGIGATDAAVRDTNTTARAKAGATQTTQQRSATAAKAAPERATSARSAVSTSSRDTSSRETATARTAVARDAKTARTAAAAVKPVPSTGTRGVNLSQRATTATVSKPLNSVSRAAVDAISNTSFSETRTGAAYEQCKNAYFTCMDQFCKLKNDDYRRCSCSDRVYDLAEVKDVVQQAGDKLTIFTEGLDTVGMSASQAAAMRTASEGENALTSDGSASKALLQAIMNSIRGEDTNVGGKFSGLNSINLSFDTANAFGTMDAGQAIAAYNGKNLYSAVYPQCRNAVKADCNDASLQRAVTAYLMAVEQDCNTVQTFIDENQKKMKAAVREGSAMLDLARVENRQQRNSDDMTTCLNNVEAAVLSEEVCGSNYHKCLDNGEFIDISTGAPIAGVVKFYELEHLLTFNDGVNVSDQQLSKVSSNRIFVQNFEKRVKKFAQPALDKCTEKADDVWADYLDKAMLDIFYAQKSKVSEIKEGCFDFVSACYVNGDKALTTAMKELAGAAGIVLQPDKVTLNSAVCQEYVASCDNMFDGNIVKQYIENRQETDTLSACRAVAKQCFDKFGGTGYGNFYYPYSGLFTVGQAADWFALYDGKEGTNYKSECAKQLSQITSCASPEMMQKAFGGLDYLPDENEEQVYGLIDAAGKFDYRALRPSGVATEIYYQIIDILSTQCTNVQGRFVELQFLKKNMYKPDNICISKFNTDGGEYKSLAKFYGIGDGENMCPRDYGLGVDTQSWGACLCWENGARRSKWGKSVKCVAEMPVSTQANDKSCSTSGLSLTNSTSSIDTKNWCTQTKLSGTNQTCPFATTKIVHSTGKCYWEDENREIDVENIPTGIL